MYRSTFDATHGIAVWNMGHFALDEDEWRTHFEDMGQIVGWSSRSGLRPVVVLEVPNAWVRPDARRRAQLSEASAVVGYDPYLAVVSGSIAARSVLTVLNWMNERPSYEAKVFASSDQGIAWLEQKRGRPLSQLRKMVDAMKSPAVAAKTRAR